jgi:hypothetical protein
MEAGARAPSRTGHPGSATASVSFWFRGLRVARAASSAKKKMAQSGVSGIGETHARGEFFYRMFPVWPSE